MDAPPRGDLIRRAGRAVGRVAVLAVLGALAWAPAAGADAAEPTDFRSEVVGIDPPAPDDVEVRVVGNDAFLEVSVGPDTTVVVPDYDPDGGPYLRFGPDGLVERNRRAAATSANEQRDGSADPEAYDPDAEPVWEVVARDGTHAWHDHRIHWMSPTPPRAVDADGVVDLGGPDGTWAVPLVIDDVPTTVTGVLRRSPAPSPLPWLALGVGATASLVVLARTRRLRSAPTIGRALGVAIASATMLASAATWRAAPAGSDPSVLPLVLSAVALIGCLAVLATGHRPRSTAHLVAASAAAATLLTWGWARRTVLVRAHLPTDLPAWVDRGATASALAVALALVIGLLDTQRDESRAKASRSVV